MESWGEGRSWGGGFGGLESIAKGAITCCCSAYRKVTVIFNGTDFFFIIHQMHDTMLMSQSVLQLASMLMPLWYFKMLQNIDDLRLF